MRADGQRGVDEPFELPEVAAGLAPRAEASGEDLFAALMHPTFAIHVGDELDHRVAPRPRRGLDLRVIEERGGDPRGEVRDAAQRRDAHAPCVATREPREPCSCLRRAPRAPGASAPSAGVS